MVGDRSKNVKERAKQVVIHNAHLGSNEQVYKRIAEAENGKSASIVPAGGGSLVAGRRGVLCVGECCA